MWEIILQICHVFSFVGILPALCRKISFKIKYVGIFPAQYLVLALHMWEICILHLDKCICVLVNLLALRLTLSVNSQHFKILFLI